MRARNRHSASNYLFAAFLELVIMGIFVVIAQPELRESLFEMLDPPARAIAAPAAAAGNPAVAAAAPATAIPNAVAPSHEAQRLPATNGAWSTAGATYAPFEQFESFAVSSSGAAIPASPVSVAAQKRVAGYAPAVGATQLNAIDWNIASVSESPRPLNAVPSSVWPMAGWTASRPAEAAYRDTYPPPYGTQSQWK